MTLKSSKDEKLEAVLNLQSMTICQKKKKALVPYHKFYIKDASTVKVTLGKF